MIRKVFSSVLFALWASVSAGGMLVYHLDFNTLQRSRKAVVDVLEKIAEEGYDAVLWEIENKVRFDCCPDIADPEAFSKAEFREIFGNRLARDLF